MFYAAFPPEINSGRMYSGAGSDPLLAAAAAWGEVANELQQAATSYSAVISSLTSGPWLGPTSLSMAAAVAPYLTWMQTTATQAAETAGQATAAASAYETAFASHVPPAEIAANRVQLAQLAATNIIGQNNAAIAATEAQYGEMWAQDALAMDTYAASSAAASKLSPYTEPPPTTNDAGTAAQSAAVAQAAATTYTGSPLLQWLANLSTDYTSTLNGLLNSMFGLVRRIDILGAVLGGESSTRVRHAVQRHRLAHQLPGIAVPQVHSGPRLRAAAERRAWGVGFSARGMAEDG